MKRFIFLLMLTICMGVANANSSYSESHKVTSDIQITQPPGGYEFDFIAPAVIASFLESNTDNVCTSIIQPANDFMIFAKIQNCISYSLCIYNADYSENFNNDSGYLSRCFTNSKYRSCTAAGINYKKHYINHYSG